MAGAKKKRVRVPFGAHRLKLQTAQRPGYVRRWFNDTEDRVQRALDGGWQFVEKGEVTVGEGALHEESTDLNNYVSKIVSKGKTASIRAYLMEIPQEYYDEDQALKEQVNKRVDEAILAGTPGGATVENAYVPDTGIKHEHR